MAGLTVEETIRLCRDKIKTDKRAALTLFFTRFHKLIDQRIYKTLISCDFQVRKDTIEQIGGEIVERLVRTDLLQQIISADNPPGYFARTINNHTLDWLREQLTNRQAPRRYVEKNLRSLSDPAHQEKDDEVVTTVEDTLPAPGTEVPPPGLLDDKPEPVGVEDIEGVWDEKIRLRGENHRLILHAIMMESQPLSPETIDKIARSRNVAIEIIHAELEKIQHDLDRRRQSRDEANRKSIQLHAEILLLQTKLFALDRTPGASEDAIQTVREKIGKKQATRQKHLKKMNTPLRPPSKQIVELLGLPENQVQTINTLISRVKKALKGKYGNNKKSEIDSP